MSGNKRLTKKSIALLCVAQPQVFWATGTIWWSTKEREKRRESVKKGDLGSFLMGNLETTQCGSFNFVESCTILKNLAES